jgi:hypothetical protein
MLVDARRLALAAVTIILALAPLSASSQAVLPAVDNPTNRDKFALNDLADWTQFSQVENFDVLGHSYFRGPWVAPGGQGTGINTLRVCGTTAYLAGYDPTVFGTVIVDVTDPAAMEALSFVPGNPGVRTAYLRANCDRKIVAMGMDTNNTNPEQPAPGDRAASGVMFIDVSNPRQPTVLGQWNNNPGGATHGLEMDDRYVYACGSSSETVNFGAARTGQILNVLDYSDPTHPQQVGAFHVPGQLQGETPGPDDQLQPNGSSQYLMCHEIIKDGDRLYVAYRDAGAYILDVSDPTHPVEVGHWDMVPPYNGDPANPPGPTPAVHTAAPAPHGDSPLPRIMVVTDEHMACPPGFGRVLDISDPRHITLLSTYHVAGVDDQYDFGSGKFNCLPGSQSTHLPYFDPRGHGSLFYQAWYGQGLRVMDISNPYYPKEVGYYLTPDTSIPTYPSRHTREAYVDPATDLVYVTDGNGGGLTVLRYTGPIPEHPPLPGVR